MFASNELILGEKCAGEAVMVLGGVFAGEAVMPLGGVLAGEACLAPTACAALHS